MGFVMFHEGFMTLSLAATTYETRWVLNAGFAYWIQAGVHRYRISAPESLTTALGCLQAQRVERIRENSKRYTRVWYAIELGYVAVRLEHGKYDGDHMEMRIESLQLDGKTIEPGSICDTSAVDTKRGQDR